MGWTARKVCSQLNLAAFNEAFKTRGDAVWARELPQTGRYSPQTSRNRSDISPTVARALTASIISGINGTRSAPGRA